MAVTFDTIEAPDYWASYFINGDASGLSEEEKAMADAWCAREGISRHEFVSCSEEPRFTWSYRLYCPEANCSGGSVLEYTYRVRATA